MNMDSLKSGETAGILKSLSQVSGAIAETRKAGEEMLAKIVSGAKDAVEDAAELINPFGAKSAAKRHPLEEMAKRVVKRTDESVLVRATFEGFSNDFKRKNPQFQKQELMDKLLDIRMKIKPDMKKEQINKVLKELVESFDNPLLVDEALEFLGLTTTGDQHLVVKAFHEDYSSKNAPAISKARAAEQVVPAGEEVAPGAPIEIGDDNKKIIDSQLNFLQMYEQLRKEYPTRAAIKRKLNSLQHDLGKRLKDPTCEHAQLYNDLSMMKNSQHLNTVFDFVEKRQNLLQLKFDESGLSMPPQMTVAAQVNVLISVYNDPHPSPDNIMRALEKLGISRSDSMMMVFVELILRDGVHNVSPKIIKNPVEAQSSILLAAEDFNEKVAEAEERAEKAAAAA